MGRTELRDIFKCDCNGHLSRLLNAMPDIFILKDGNGRWIEANAATLELFGLKEEEYIGKTDLDISAFCPSFKETLLVCAKTDELAWQFGKTKRDDELVKMPDGRQVLLDVLKTPFFKPDGSREGLMVIARDITGVRETIYELELAKTIFKLSIEGIVITDSNGDIIQVNPAFTAITGYTNEEVAGKNPRILKSDRHDAQFYAGMWKSLSDTGRWSGEIWNRRKNGEIYPEWLTIQAVRDINGNLSNYISIFHDLTETKQYQERFKFYKYFDPLTGLVNRTHLIDHLADMIEQDRLNNHIERSYLIMIDIDRFKEVNEALSYETGDVILKEIAEKLKTMVAKDTHAARIGEDCFAAILKNGSRRSDIASFLEELNTHLRGLRPSSMAVHITASMGISVYPDDATKAEELLRNAELALIDAKRSGGNAYRFFNKSLFEQANNRMRLINRLKSALGKGELVPYYQPKVEILTGNIMAFEALIRWRQEDGTITAPSNFIPIAEETGLIVPITMEFMDIVAKNLATLKAEGRRLGAAINFSPMCFKRGRVLDAILDLSRRYDIPPKMIQMEITETLLMENAKELSIILNEFSEHEILIAMDDFGTGYSSLSYLKDLPIDLVKIDKSFIRDITTSLESMRIVQAILAMTDALGIKVCAEGVETREQLNILKRLGCNQIQGYLFSPPVPFDEILPLFEKNLWRT
ncbi:MAG: EAL domain-containing protein [Desulfobacteraceae bacterium]|nr:EAL domain-containing protein [Desulfobacteraceae bacterium]